MRHTRELFLHELKYLYYVEQALVKKLPQLAGEATDGELAEGFANHLRETNQHVANLEKVFETLDEQAEGQNCPGFDGIAREHDRFMDDENPSSEIRDLFLTGAAARAEHYEIAAYSGLVAIATALGEWDSVDLLEQNLKQEGTMLKKVGQIGKRLAKETAATSRQAA